MFLAHKLNSEQENLWRVVCLQRNYFKRNFGVYLNNSIIMLIQQLNQKNKLHNKTVSLGFIQENMTYKF